MTIAKFGKVKKSIVWTCSSCIEQHKVDCDGVTEAVARKSGGKDLQDIGWRVQDDCLLCDVCRE